MKEITKEIPITVKVNGNQCDIWCEHLHGRDRYCELFKEAIIMDVHNVLCRPIRTDECLKVFGDGK